MPPNQLRLLVFRASIGDLEASTSRMGSMVIVNMTERRRCGLIGP